MKDYNLTDTIVALSTPPGTGALGVIRLSGNEAIAITDRVFWGKKLANVESHTLHFGTIKDGDRVLDEVVVGLFKGPKSYTKEDVVEVSCHGSPYIIQEVIQLFLREGARMAQPGEFTMRAFLNGRMDLSQAEAVADLIASTSASAHGVAMQQMRGGFSDEIQKLRQELIDFASLIELELDFAEEDVEFADRTKLVELVHKIQGLLRDLIDSFRLGNAIKHGVSTVIAGRPNAGKSTLLNALLKEERAIVSEIAGTTRDTIEEVLNINGIAFRLIDTAGIRDAQDTIEAVGVEKTMEKIAQSAILVYVFDAVNLSIEEVEADLAKLHREGLEVLVVANKVDQLADGSRQLAVGSGQSAGGSKQSAPADRQLPTAHWNLPTANWLPVSALERTNIDSLKDRLYNTVLSGEALADQTVVSNARHYEALQKAYESLDDVLKGMEEGVTSDFVAMDIRRALAYLGEITGEVSVDDLLGNIFSRFCIGK